MEEIIAGVGFGIFIAFILGWWAMYKSNGVLPTLEEAASTIDTTVPLQKRLRDAIYDCERQQQQCNTQIDHLCKELLDLLQDVGRVSYVGVKGKPLFFDYQHPLTGERRYYYERDLSKQIDPSVLERTRKVAQQYQQHLDALLTQRAIFEQLIRSHQENLDRINGVQQQGKQAEKLAQHQEKLAQLKNDPKEEKAIYNQLLLNEIEEEVNYQEECMRQYIDLSQTYQRPIDQPLDAQYQTQLQQLLHQLESEDPTPPDFAP